MCTTLVEMYQQKVCSEKVLMNFRCIILLPKYSMYQPILSVILINFIFNLYNTIIISIMLVFGIQFLKILLFILFKLHKFTCILFLNMCWVFIIIIIIWRLFYQEFLFIDSKYTTITIPWHHN